MKITVTKECYDEAVARVTEYMGKRVCDMKPGEFYGSHCLFAVAGEKAGLDVSYVQPALIKLKNGVKFILPSEARWLLSQFDKSVNEHTPFPLEELPAEFDITEVAYREDRDVGI